MKKILMALALGLMVRVAHADTGDIPLSSNFQENTGRPLDARIVVADSTARLALPSTQVYNGMMVFQRSDSTNWQLQGSTFTWVQIVSGGSSSAAGPVTAVQFNSTGTFNGNSHFTTDGSSITVSTAILNGFLELDMSHNSLNTGLPTVSSITFSQTYSSANIIGDMYSTVERVITPTPAGASIQNGFNIIVTTSPLSTNSASLTLQGGSNPNAGIFAGTGSFSTGSSGATMTSSNSGNSISVGNTAFSLAGDTPTFINGTTSNTSGALGVRSGNNGSGRVILKLNPTTSFNADVSYLLPITTPTVQSLVQTSPNGQWSFLNTLTSSLTVTGASGIGSTFGIIGGSLTANNITGTTQCVQADSSGHFTGTGSACGAGGGSSASTLGVNFNGVSITTPTAQINFVGSGVSVSATGSTATVTIAGSGGSGLTYSSFTATAPVLYNNAGNFSLSNTINSTFTFTNDVSIGQSTFTILGGTFVIQGVKYVFPSSPTAGNFLEYFTTNTLVWGYPQGIATLPLGSAGQVPYINTSNQLQLAQIYYNDANTFVGILDGYGGIPSTFESGSHNNFFDYGMIIDNETPINGRALTVNGVRNTTFGGPPNTLGFGGEIGANYIQGNVLVAFADLWLRGATLHDTPQSNQGYVYFDSGTQHMYGSENGNAYGQMDISNSTITYTAPKTFTSALIISSNVVANGIYGSSGTVLTSAGFGLPAYWSTSSGGGGVTSVTGTAPISSSGGTTPAISLSQTIGQSETITGSSLTVAGIQGLTVQGATTAPLVTISTATGGVPAVQISSTLAAASSDFSQTISSQTGTLVYGVQYDGHIVSSGTTPSMGTCGSTPSVNGTDTAGVITVGSGVVTSCTMNFANVWANPPVCVESDNSTAVTGDITTTTTSSITFGFSATLGGGQVNYICFGNKG